MADWGKVGGWFKDNADWLVPGAIGLWSANESGKQTDKADKYNEQALQFEMQKFLETEPFRRYAMASLGNSSRPMDTSGLFRDAGNPYSASYDYTRDYTNTGPEVSGAPAGTPGMFDSTGNLVPTGDWQLGGKMNYSPDQVRAIGEANYTSPGIGTGSGQAYSSPEEARRMTDQDIEEMLFLQRIGVPGLNGRDSLGYNRSAR